MSSRALRKIQREQERKKQLQQSQQPTSEDEDTDEEVASQHRERKAFNAFDMLNAAGDEEKSDHASDIDEEREASTETNEVNVLPKTDVGPNHKTKPKKKKKKNKAGTAKADTPSKASGNGQGTEPQDEIDAALASLSVKSLDGSSAVPNIRADESELQLCRLLEIESKHLNAVNEMKRLFGNIMSEDENPSPNRRRGRGPQHLDLGRALAARHSPVSRGQGLSGLALRRNVFMNGKEEWPKATTGGLGMELDEKDKDGVKHFRFVHNTTYQDVQRQFESCVESMDPQRMIIMLQYNPYHISTLLQVSEIAKQQGDHSVSGDLLERALFSFGRSVQSSFSNALTEGKARLDFRRPENREFWLAAWRYIANLGQRGTWRTAYEWAKLLLSLDPEGDPYCVTMVIDQLALRGGQAEHFLSLTSNPAFLKYQQLYTTNIDISTSLAEYKLKRPQDCRSSLSNAISSYPWVFALLFQELNIERLPPSIWGKEPRTARERFESETYVLGAKDLWNTPETIQLLTEVVEYAPSVADGDIDLANHPITLSEARHVLLSGNPRLTALLPRDYTTMPSSASDPLPPPDNIESYSTAIPQPSRSGPQSGYTDPFDSDDTTSPANSRPQTPRPNSTDIPAPTMQNVRNFFSRLMAWPNPNADPQTEDELAAIDTAAREGQLDQLAADLNAAYPHAEQQPTVESDPEDEGEPAYNEDRNKRWLAGQGLQAVKTFVDDYGSDPRLWDRHQSEIVSVYADRVAQLREVNRRFILDYALPQGAGREVKELIVRVIGR